jgi:cellulose synthase/poly-beta-1,6-N-acetylglucosamine synthase-like glycosyltransferase
MRQFIITLIWILNAIALVYVVVINLIYSVQLVAAWRSLRKYLGQLRYANIDHYVESENMIPISVLVPAYNESATIVDNTKNNLNL